MGRQGTSNRLVQYNTRLLESDTAKEYGIPFDNNWYSLHVKTREVMVAGRLGKQWLDMLQEEDAVRRSSAKHIR